jgi:hypothetical protein
MRSADAVGECNRFILRSLACFCEALQRSKVRNKDGSDTTHGLRPAIYYLLFSIDYCYEYLITVLIRLIKGANPAYAVVIMVGIIITSKYQNAKMHLKMQKDRIAGGCVQGITLV